MPNPAAPTHAALMDQVYRRQRYIYDLTRKYYLFGRDRMIRNLALSPGESAVEVGCGTARNLIRIARTYPGAALFGLDASAEMLETAAENVARAGLGERIRLVRGYAEALSPAPFGRDAAFDRVLFPYSLSMIPDWRQALVAGDRALADTGRMFVVDFGDLKGLGPVAGSLLRGWLHLFHVEPRVEILRAMEASPGKGTLSLLPARYAFLWQGGKGAASAFAGNHVASQTQPAGNPHAPGTGEAVPVDMAPPYPSQ